MCLGGNKTPKAPKPEPLPEPPKQIDEATRVARKNQRQQAAAMKGYAGTIATSSLGDTADPNLAKLQLGA